MKKLKIVLLSSVLAISLGQAASAAYSQEQLTTLRALVESGNTGAVMAYINANSDLLTGTDPLALALQEFINSREGVLGGIFGQRMPNLGDVPDVQSAGFSGEPLETGSLSQFGS